MARDVSQPLRFLPVGLDVRRRRCVVVGGGSIGHRKVQTLVRADADAIVVSPRVAPELKSLIDGGRAAWIEAGYRDEHVEGAFLVIAATDDRALNARIVATAAERGALVCDASSAEGSQVIFGALLTHGPANIAVFTDGQDPSHSRELRDRIAELLDSPDQDADPD